MTTECFDEKLENYAKRTREIVDRWKRNEPLTAELMKREAFDVAEFVHNGALYTSESIRYLVGVRNRVLPVAEFQRKYCEVAAKNEEFFEGFGLVDEFVHGVPILKSTVSGVMDFIDMCYWKVYANVTPNEIRDAIWFDALEKTIERLTTVTDFTLYFKLPEAKICDMENYGKRFEIDDDFNEEEEEEEEEEEKDELADFLSMIPKTKRNKKNNETTTYSIAPRKKKNKIEALEEFLKTPPTTCGTTANYLFDVDAYMTQLKNDVRIAKEAYENYPTMRANEDDLAKVRGIVYKRLVTITDVDGLMGAYKKWWFERACTPADHAVYRRKHRKNVFDATSSIAMNVMHFKRGTQVDSYVQFDSVRTWIINKYENEECEFVSGETIPYRSFDDYLFETYTKEDCGNETNSSTYASRELDEYLATRREEEGEKKKNELGDYFNGVLWSYVENETIYENAATFALCRRSVVV